MDAVRGIARFLLLVGTISRALLEFRISPPIGIRERAEWLHRLSRKVLRILGARLAIHGIVPGEGLIASNHLSYLDIIAIGSVAPVVFVSKQEVARWPFFGWSATRGGTIYIDRERRGAVADAGTRMKEVLEVGVPLVFFPEGTSSGGESVLPFHAPLFAPVVELRCPVAPCTIRYRLPGANVPEEVCYWRPEHTLAPHLLNLFSRTGLEITLVFGPSHPRTADRKTLARELRAEVAAGISEP